MDLSSWLTDTVTIAAASGVTAAGDPTFGSQSTIKARVEHATQLIRDPAGSIVESNHVVATTTALTQAHRVWLPGDDTSDTAAARRIVVVKRATSKDGSLTLYEAYL